MLFRLHSFVMELFIADLDAVGKEEEKAYAALLNADETVRLTRMSVWRRKTFLTGRALVRDVLGQIMGLPPAAVELRLLAGGAPVLKEDGPFFNLSHSGHFVLMAVDDTPVGADIENSRSNRNIDGMVREYFDEAAKAAYFLLDPKERRSFFYRLWTMKEAALKLKGCGGTDIPLMQGLKEAPTEPVHFYSGRLFDYFFAVAGKDPLRTMQLILKTPLKGRESFLTPESTLLS